MKTRIISACVLIVIVVSCFAISPVTRALLLLAAAVLAVREMCSALSAEDAVCSRWILYVYVLAAFAAVYLKADPIINEALFFFAVFAVLTAGITVKKTCAQGAVRTMFVLVYPVVPFLIILSLALSENWLPVFSVGCISTWVCDSFALFGGKRFGKNKLCPEISPNKTIEGTICGALASAVAGMILSLFLDYSLPVCTITALICSSFGQVGDLAASLIKRMAGIKDYSNLIPGHGGIMDRVDSLLFAVPVAYFCLTIL